MNAIIDNWTLQTVRELLSDGFSNDDANVIQISNDTHNYANISHCIVQAEALFDILTEIVLRDTLVVDSGYTQTWESPNSPIMPLVRELILRRKPFCDFEDDFEELRSYLADSMCVTKSLKDSHAENVLSWAKSGKSVDPYLSAVMWGGAGMVARSSTFGFPYSPHPLRRRIFLETGLFLDDRSPHSRIQSSIDENRLRLIRSSVAENQLYSLRVVLPPIPSRVIDEANGPTNIIETAIQLRQEFAPLRTWLSEVEDAVGSDDLVRVRKLHKVLDEITRKVDNTIGVKKTDATLSVGLAAIRFSMGISLGRPLLKATKVYSILNQITFSSSGESALRKLCLMFGDNTAVVERKLREHFSAQ